MDDGIGVYGDKLHADSLHCFMNTLCPDLQYTIEHPSSDSHLPFLEMLIHPDKSTSVYRKYFLTENSDISKWASTGIAGVLRIDLGLLSTRVLCFSKSDKNDGVMGIDTVPEIARGVKISP